MEFFFGMTDWRNEIVQGQIDPQQPWKAVLEAFARV